jgi:oligopeptide transport system ATP-binding protein
LNLVAPIGGAFVEPTGRRRHGEENPVGSHASTMLIDHSLQIDEGDVLLRAISLSKSYTRGRRWSRRRCQVEALRSIDLEIRAGSTVAVVGASGSGKSTLARCLARLEEPDSGEIWFAGKHLTRLTHRELMPFRRQIQLILQEPEASLNPRFPAVEIVAEPLLITGLGTKRERREKALALMELVGLGAHLGNRMPSELSGGQRRRLAIARALVLEPKLVILDEALTGLDLSTRAQIANLLLQLQEARSLTYVYISHDFGLVTRLADEVVVLDNGRIVAGGAPELVARSRQPQPAQAPAGAVTLSSPVELP